MQVNFWVTLFLLLSIIIEAAQQTDDGSLNKSGGGNSAIKVCGYLLNGKV